MQIFTIWRKDMKVASYYKYLLPGSTDVAYSGMGCGYYWQNVIGIKLQQMLGKATVVGRLHSPSSRTIERYPILDDDYDISYCQLFDIPFKRPSGFVYGIISDFIRMEVLLTAWLEEIKPDVLFTTQYYKSNLITLCAKYSCKCEFLPWFNVEKEPYIEDKIVTAMSTGAIGPTYPQRTMICDYLMRLNRDDVISKSTNDQKRYPLSKEEYVKNLRRTKYYITGGIFDFQIPPKYFEVCNYGACLVSSNMPMMEKCGFVDGKTYIELNSIAEIDDIIASDRWREIAPAGQKMVQERHMIENRKDQILKTYARCN